MVFCLYVAIAAQETIWKPVGPGGNGWLMTGTIHPASGSIYFSVDMNLSLLRSTDQGETWQAISNPVAGTVFYVAGDPKESNTIYINQQGAAPKASGIWKSMDNGDTWEHIYPSDEFGISRGQSGLVDPDNNKILYWTAADMGVRRSDDGGFIWEDISTGLPKEKIKHGRHLNELEIDINTQLANRRIFYPTNVGLYQMTEPNHEWKLVAGNGLPGSNCTDVQSCTNNIIYAALPDHGIFKSMDGGKSWHQIKNGLEEKSGFRVIATKRRPDIVYVATNEDKGIYGSQDGGISFRQLTYWRYNSKLNWPMNYRQHESVSGQILLIDPNDPYTVYADYNKKTHDGGQSWQHYGTKEVSRDRWTGTGLTLLTDYRVVFDPNHPDLVWLGFSDTGLMLSEDRGESIINLISFHRGEVNQAAYWRNKLVHTSGSCVSMAVDPELSTTIYASINGKNANNRAAVGGFIIKSVDGGWNWRPIYEKNGLDDGIVRSIIIDPASPIYNRTIYVASYGNGVYKSMDDGNTFKCITVNDMFKGNTRIMWLEMAPSDPKTLYLGVGGSYGIRPITFGPTHYPALKSGMYGGVFKTTDGGKIWEKCNTTREIPSVQDIAVHPTNPDIVYAAAYYEDYLLPDGKNHQWAQGGVFKSTDGGINWEIVFKSPVDDYLGQGELEGICINPVSPEIVYAAVRRYGIYRTLDAAKTWEPVGQKSISRMQRRFHSIDLNPHDPAEVWLAHFGNSFSKGVDFKAKKYMQDKFYGANFIENPGFEKIDDSTHLPHKWKVEQPAQPNGEKPVISLSQTNVNKGNYAVRFNLTRAYCEAPSVLPAVREQLRLEKEGKIPPATSKVKREGTTGETNSWMYQKINPYFTELMRGKRISLEMDIFIKERNWPPAWYRGSERGEIPRDPPQVYLTEVRDFNVHWLVAETSIEETAATYKTNVSDMNGKWYHCRAIGRVTEDAHWLRVTITGVGEQSGTMDVFVDNVKLTLCN
jgi:photosystem II stability/assembly factor-like uncharacterized protein